MKPFLKKKIVLKRRKRGRKKKKHEQTDLSVKVLNKNMNGASNWEQLSKVIGYDISKRKSTSNTSLLMDTKSSYSKNVPVIDFTHKNQGVPKTAVNPKPSHSISSGLSNGASSNSHQTAVIDPMRNVANSFLLFKPETRPPKQDCNVSYQKTYTPDNSASSNLQIPSQRHGITRVVAMDCEMVGTGSNGEDSMIARVSLVNHWGDCLYDSYVKPMETVTDYRTPVSGIRPHNLAKGKDLFTVQREVQQILDGRILVGHALKNDLSVLFISHPKSMTRDTSRYKPFRELFNGQTPSLKKLAEKLLGAQIQTGEHSSVEDAQAAMQIYLTHKREWEDTVKYIKKKRMHYQQHQEQE